MDFNKTATDLMDFSMIDTTNTFNNYDLVSISPPIRSSILNNNNNSSSSSNSYRLTVDTTDVASFDPVADFHHHHHHHHHHPTVPNIYPSLGDFKSNKPYRNAAAADDDIVDFYFTNRHSDDPQFDASKAAKDPAGSAVIELDMVKHKISSLWNNVKYGWSSYLKRSKISLDSHLPIFILGKSFACENYKQLKKSDDASGMTSFYESLEKPDDDDDEEEEAKKYYDEYDELEAPREMPIYSVKDSSLDNYSINSSYIFPALNRLSPKAPTTALNSFLMTLNNTGNLKLPSPTANRLDSTYLIVDDDKQQQQSTKQPVQINQPQKQLHKTNSSSGGAMLHQNFINENMKTSLDQEIYSRIWFTYRKDFEPLKGNPKYTSDCGWGCMLRSAQMLIAQALLMHFFKSRWSLYSSLKSENDLVMYKQILVWFNDRPSLDCPFGIHRLLEIADSKTFEAGPTRSSVGDEPPAKTTRVGTWFGPTSVCLLMRDAMNEAYEANPLLRQLKIYCAQDCTIYKQDVLDLCTTRDEATGETRFVACIILVSVRLGGEDLNEIYTPSLQRFLSMSNCIGLIGGKPKHSLYFIGYQGHNVIYLDPHISQPVAPLYQHQQQQQPAYSLTHSYIDAAMSSDSTFNNTSYHCASPNKTAFSKLDPSLAIGFYCANARELNELCDFVHSMASSDEMCPIFGVNNDSYESAHKHFQVYCDDEASVDRATTTTTTKSININGGKRKEKTNKLISNYLPSLSGNSFGRFQNSLTNRFLNNDQAPRSTARSLSNDQSSASNASSTRSSKGRSKKENDKDDFVLI